MDAINAYTQRDIDRVFNAGRAMARAIEHCHLRAEHRAEVNAAISGFSKTFIHVCEYRRRANKKRLSCESQNKEK